MAGLTLGGLGSLWIVFWGFVFLGVISLGTIGNALIPGENAQPDKHETLDPKTIHLKESDAPSTFKCPNCRRPLRYDPKMAGHKTECPWCQQKLVMPSVKR